MVFNMIKFVAEKFTIRPFSLEFFGGQITSGIILDQLSDDILDENDNPITE